MFHKLLLVHILFALALAICSKTCSNGTCSVTGMGLGESCGCATHRYGDIEFEYAKCEAQSARSIEMTVDSSSCKTNGNNAKAQISSMIYANLLFFVPQCTASSATQCSQRVDYSWCEIIGTTAKCSAQFLHLGSSSWLVPKCEAYGARQCAIACPGISSCSKDCALVGKYSVCKCVVNRDTGLVDAECTCSIWPMN
ncbi:hypothetical protein RCL1_008021 [Eukaryota sp. TZLM3-RCL]